MNHYHRLLKSGSYTAASNYLCDSNVFSYGAWFLNVIEDRIVKIEEYAMSLKKNTLTTYQSPEPTENLYQNMVWVGDSI